MTYQPGGGGGGAPTTATYITQTANGSLSNEQALASLSTGLMKVTTTTGVISTAVAGTDYAAASHTHIIGDTTGLQTALDGKQPDLQFKDEGSNAGTSGGVSVVDFVGAGVSAAESGGTLTVTISGGAGVSDGATLSTGLTFPNTGLHLLDTNATHDLILAPGSDLTADRTLTLTTGDADRTLTLSGNATLSGGTHSGTNTGDQTITLTGDVTGSGTGSFAATIADDAVTYAKLQNTTGTDLLLGRSTAGAGIVEEIACTAAGRALLDDATAADQRATLSLGTLATQSGTFSGTSSGTNTGDVTLAGTPDYITISGQQITRGQIDLAADVTGDLPYANLVQATGASVLVGRGSAAGAGDLQEIALGSGLSMSGTTLSASGAPSTASYLTISSEAGLSNERSVSQESGVTLITDNTTWVEFGIATNGIGNTKFRQSAGFSVVGKATTGTGNVADITASAVGQALMYSGSSIQWVNPGLGKHITVESPSATEDISIFFTEVAITVSKMAAVLVGSSTPSVTWTIRHSTDRSATGNEVVTSGTTTTSTTTGSIVTSFNDATIPANSFVWLETTAQSGTVTSLHVSILYSKD